MEEETLKIFDEHKRELGTASRKDVHKKGLWHETFQCWLVSKEEKKHYIYLQKRSSSKKDFPNLFDITAAGHLLSNETIHDGIREVKEELGINVEFHDLVSLGMIQTRMTIHDFVDHEFAHVFLYNYNESFDDFKVQIEEVSGIVKVDMEEFYKLWHGKINEVSVNGFEMLSGKKVPIHKTVTRQHFVPHELSYYKTIIDEIRNAMFK